MIIRPLSLGAATPVALRSIGEQCLAALPRHQSRSAQSTRRAFTTARVLRTALSKGPGQAQRLRAGYFLNNSFLPRTAIVSKARSSTSTSFIASQPPIPAKDAAAPVTETTPEVDLPHRRRQKARKDAQAASAEAGPSAAAEPVIPPDASSVLTTASSNLPINSFKRTLSTLLALTKPRLSFLIVLTTTSAYSIYPVPALLSPAITDTPSLSALTLLFLTFGTSLTCASANTLNMLYEPKWDAMMSRTKNRPLVRGLISSRGALLFAALSAAIGTGALYYGVNPTVASLAAFNIFLYAGVYTPLKRVSVLNTWVGALVGGIPPLMGWAAAAGQTATGSGDWKELLLGYENLGGWLLAALLVAWQFPHFMALSWTIRHEYKNAGYKMLAWTNPARNGRVALRYSLVMLPLCVGLCAVGVTEWSFAVASTPVNLWMVREAYRFWKYEGLKGSARGLFWASVWHLPAVMVLAMVEKKGMWQRVWRAVGGAVEDDEWEEIEEDEVPGKTTVASV
ncbi:hypothetical protein V495_07895 [Pseudogymnoascus sp. VKM F-4514 (FW-929)]|nr:hypothetical protein V495_07895 [Pseudogymnoascus sp. VKM F-4514 (FW-929)]KFY58873.1 hypothetical protein V497_04589 [Pseudogymnoascus sp. VKM F-4516 (FW-969)]